jgi:tetratricopeptide (TPR) repeat protein
MGIQNRRLRQCCRTIVKVLPAMVMLYGVIHIMGRVEQGAASAVIVPASSRALDGDELLRIGDLHEVQHHWQEALPYYQRALAAFREKRIRRGEAEALLKIGHVLERQNRLNEAFASVDESLRVLSRSRDWKMQARTLLQRGQIAEALERWTEALTSYEQAAQVFHRAHDAEGRIKALVKRGALQIRHDQVREGLNLLQGAHQEARDQSLLAEQMAALLWIGEAHLYLEDPDAARRAWEAGLAFALSLQEMKHEAVFSIRLARLHESAAAYGVARTLAQRALVLSQSMRDRPGQGEALSLLGTIDLDEGDVEKAAAHHQGALELYRALRDRSREAASLINLGIVSDFQGSSQPAQELYSKALSILQSAP